MRIEGLSIDYVVPEGHLHVVQDVTLEFPTGQVTAVIGESGSGKSTLINACLGLLAPNALCRSGQILWQSQDLLQMNAEQLRCFRWAQASVVFQAAQGAFNPTLTLGEQMLDSGLDHGQDRAEGERRREQLLRQVRLDPNRIIPAYPHQLSGGMRQRVLIAMALMLQPELLILDEPTTALDLITQSYVFDILAEVQKTYGLTMVLITHDLPAVAKLADRVAVLYGGKLLEVAEAQQIFENPRHPYTQNLLASYGGKAEMKEATPDPLRRFSGCVYRARCPLATEECAEAPPFREGVACHLS